jgi:hypothetical protein
MVTHTNIHTITYKYTRSLAAGTRQEILTGLRTYHTVACVRACLAARVRMRRGASHDSSYSSERVCMALLARVPARRRAGSAALHTHSSSDMLRLVCTSSALLAMTATPAEGADNRRERFPVHHFSQPETTHAVQTPRLHGVEAASPAAAAAGDVCAAFGAAPGKQICAKSLLFNSTLDHFDPTSSARWEHRYLFRDDDWGKASPLENGCPGPILLCTPCTH